MKRFLIILFASAAIASAQNEAVTINTKTKKVVNPLVNFGTGNTVDFTGATVEGLTPGLTFADSLLNTANTITLVNDSATPGNSKYYGTDSGGVLGYHTISSGGVTSFNTRSGAVTSQTGDYTAGQVTGAVPDTRTVNGHALSSNVTVTASDVGAPSGSGTSSGTNTGDQTSIVGISGTLSEFNTALTGADFATGGGVITGTSSGTNTGDQTADGILGLSTTGLVKRTGSQTYSTTTDNSSNWDTAFSEKRQWDGGSTNLVAATGRTSLGGTTVGQSIFTLTNPSAITWIRMNADNTVTARSASDTLTDIGAQPLDSDLTSWAGVTRASGFDTFTATPTSANLRGLLSDENGTGAALFDGATSPTFVTPALGAATATSINGNTFTIGTYTLTGVAGKTLTFNKSLTLDGTDSTTMTFPTTSATIARTDAANTFTGASTATSWVFTTPVLGTPTSGTMTNVTGTADGLTAGDVTRNHAVYAAASPPTVDVGIFTIVKTGCDLKTNATIDIFTVPSGRTFTCIGAQAIPTTVTSGLAVQFAWIIRESGGSVTMTQTTAAVSAAPLTTKVWSLLGSWSAAVSPLGLCAAGNKVQAVLTTAFTTSGTVTGSIFVTGYYVQ